MTKYIGSPLNYVGNKLKLLEEIYPILPHDIDTISEPFCGSAVLSLNSGVKNLILNDSSSHATQLLEYFKSKSFNEIVQSAEKIIKDYGFTDTFHKGYSEYPVIKNEGLSRYNKEPYTRLKEDYNKSPTVEKLFILILFGFNHFIRLNKKGQFNVPVGKVDFSKTARDKLESYLNLFTDKDIKIFNSDYRNPQLYTDLTSKSLIYIDPPYLITNAPYNSTWDENSEKNLLAFLDALNKQDLKFALSNAVENNGLKNEILDLWMKKYNIHFLHKDYKTSNYHRKNNGATKEVLITNF